MQVDSVTTLRRVAVASLLLCAVSIHDEGRAQVRPPESFTVDRTDDTLVDACDNAVANDCTLRGALSVAIDGDIIIFDTTIFPDGQPTPTMIRVTSPLPPITAGGVTLWGTSSGRPRVTLDGSEAGAGVDGLVVRSDANFIRGLWIQNFSGAGIRVEGANNTIGGLTDCGPSQTNVLVRNGIGLHITGEAADNNTITSGYIGRIYGIGNDPAGPFGNTVAGVLVDAGADSNAIGAGCFGVQIADNLGHGFVLRGADTTNNYINDGQVTGSGGHGVFIDGASGYRMGHAVNITDNGGDGVRIEGATATRNNVSQTYSSAQLSGNGGLAINLVGGNEDAFGVTANDDGDTDSGPNGLLNTPVITGVAGAGGGQVSITGTACASCAVRVYHATRDASGHGQIGGSITQTSANAEGAWSVTTNLSPGAWVTASATDAEGNTSELAANVQGPLEILVDRTDDDLVVDCSDAPDDCTLRGALTIARPGDTISFATTVFRNENQPGIIILEEPLPHVDQGLLTIRASSGRPRVWIDGGLAGPGANGLVLSSDGNLVQGLRLMGFSGDGLVIEGANNVIGWSECGQSNGLWLSGNDGFGVAVRGEEADGNRFYYMEVGSAEGDVDDGNLAGGILIEGGADNTNIGPGCYGPFIGANVGPGVVVRGEGTTSTTINSSTVGRQGAGNGSHGIHIQGGQGFRVGNVMTIDHNGGDGVRVESGSGHHILPSYSSSSIRNNGGLAINLVAPGDPESGVTPNDAGDADEGPNGLLNSPVISSIESLGGGQVTIRGIGCAGCSIALFIAEADPSGHGELSNYLGGASVNAEGAWQSTVALSPNSVVTALAFDTNQNTSEAALNVAGPRALVVDRTDDANVGACTDLANDCTLRGAIAAATAGDTIRFASQVFPQGGGCCGPPTVTFIQVGSALPPITAGRVTIDGGTSGDPWVGIDGTNAGASTHGLVVSSDRNFIHGLHIRRFSGHGILVEGANNEIGRNRDICGPNGGNTLVHNGGYGVAVRGAAAISNNVRFNKVGFLPDGSSGPNALGGVLISDGATQTGLGNGQCYGIEIHGNGGPGVTVRGAETQSTFLGELYVGRQSNPNQGDGVWVDGAVGVTMNTVMRIEHNTGAGVRVSGATARGVRVTPHYSSSSIRNNGGLAVDLEGPEGVEREDGVTLNDPGDRDMGPNGYLNYPGVYSVRGLGDGRYTLRGTACPSCSIGVFLAANDPSGHGEAERYLGGTTADSFGIWTSTVFVGAPTLDTVLTLNTSDTAGNTSEFGANIVLLEAVLETDVCGNGTHEPNEECDDGDTESNDGCSAVCRIESCGDGIVQSGIGEVCDVTCDDGNPCTVDDRCEEGCGGCVGTMRDCDDGNPCTVDSCDPASGCVHTAIACDDGDACTVDRCDAELGCVFERQPLEGVVDATCDSVDEDCDGATDEDYVGVTVTCGIGPCLATGVTQCQGGAIVESCTPLPKLALRDISCDGIDDDCDGTDDDDVPVETTTCGLGVCAGQEGVRMCQGGAMVESCDATNGASAEICDGLDNDCDGFVDDANGEGTTLCLPVETTITSGPSELTAATTATFTFTGTNASSFECSLDGAAWQRCVSGESAEVEPGSHTMLVRGVGPDGAPDPTPAFWSWTVDLTAPETAIASGPADPSQSGEATFVFTSTAPNASYVCTLDTAPIECTAMLSLSGLAEGEHTLTVYSVSSTGLMDASPATWTWVVDTTRPETTLTSGPATLTAETAASFTFTSPDEGARFECRVDGGEFAPCESGTSVAELSDGDHLFEVRAIDAAGNADPTPARWSWTVDTRGPVVSIVAGPLDPSQSGEASFGFASDEPAELRCALDMQGEGAPDVSAWPVCAPSTQFEGLAEGEHTLYVVGQDEAGNWGEVVVWTWHIDTSAPETEITAGPDEVSARGAGASFEFEDPSDVADGFECRLDGGEWVACDSGAMAYGAELAVGVHRFEVRSCAGEVCDPTPALWMWQVSSSVCPLDAEAPVLTCGAEIAIECGSGASFTAEYESEDACGEPAVEVHEPSTLELGLNPIVVVATDGNGNTSSCVQPVRVTDTQAPTLSCGGALEVPLAEDAARCEVSAAVTAPTVSDTCDSAVVVVSDAPSRYPVGNTEVTFTALDKAGNTASCAVTVTAVDATAPRVSCGSSQATLESDITPRASDACGAVLDVELSACVAVRDGVEIDLGEDCPVVGREGRIVVGDDLSGVFDGDVLVVRYRAMATDPSGNRAEELCETTLEPGRLPISPSEIAAFGSGGCSGGGLPWLLLGVPFLCVLRRRRV